MAYEKTIWQNGDTITAEKLNKIENGISGSSPFFIVNVNSEQSYTLLQSNNAIDLYIDKSGTEIAQAFADGKTPIISIVDSMFPGGISYRYLYLESYDTANGEPNGSFSFKDMFTLNTFSNGANLALLKITISGDIASGNESYPYKATAIKTMISVSRTDA